MDIDRVDMDMVIIIIILYNTHSIALFVANSEVSRISTHVTIMYNGIINIVLSNDN